MVHFGGAEETERERKVTISKNLDYDGLFDALFQKNTNSVRPDYVKTSNVGTLYELHGRSEG